MSQIFRQLLLIARSLCKDNHTSINTRDVEMVLFWNIKQLQNICDVRCSEECKYASFSITSYFTHKSFIHLSNEQRSTLGHYSVRNSPYTRCCTYRRVTFRNQYNYSCALHSFLFTKLKSLIKPRPFISRYEIRKLAGCPKLAWDGPGYMLSRGRTHSQ